MSDRGPRPSRRSLWWLLGPPVLFCVALVPANRVDPWVLGMPFLVFWLLLATLLSPVCVWLAARGDPVRKANRR
jgi:hypothetical protein